MDAAGKEQGAGGVVVKPLAIVTLDVLNFAAELVSDIGMKISYNM